MAPKKVSKTRKVTRAKATKKTSVRTSRKAPGTTGPKYQGDKPPVFSTW
jgi:hypothetical protein